MSSAFNIPAGFALVPVELLKDAAESVDDYRAGTEFGAHDRKLLGRLKAALVAPPVNAVQGEQSQLAKDFPPMGGLTECDMGDSYE